MKRDQVLDDPRLVNRQVRQALAEKLDVERPPIPPAEFFDRPVLYYTGTELIWRDKSHIEVPFEMVYLQDVICPTCWGHGTVYNGEDEPSMACPCCSETDIIDISASVTRDLNSIGSQFRNCILSVSQEHKHYATIGDTHHYLKQENLREYSDPDFSDRPDLMSMAAYHPIRAKIDEEIIRTMCLTPKVVEFTHRPMEDVLPALKREFIQGILNKNLFDDQVYGAVSWSQWSSMLTFSEFHDAPFLTEDQLPYKNMQAKRFNHVTWFPSNYLPVAGGCQSAFIFSTTSVAHVLNENLKATFDREEGDISAQFEHVAGLANPDRILRLVTK